MISSYKCIQNNTGSRINTIVCVLVHVFIYVEMVSFVLSVDSQDEVRSLEQELKRSNEAVFDLKRKLKLSEDEKAAFEKVSVIFVHENVI